VKVLAQTVQAEQTYYAHSHKVLPEAQWHTLPDHLRGVGALASEFASVFKAGAWGYLLGLNHDLGKFSSAFQARLRGSNKKVDHSTAGALLMHELYGAQAAYPLMLSIAGHHSGLENLSALLSGERLHDTGKLASYKQIRNIIATAYPEFVVKHKLDVPAYAAGDQLRVELFIRMIFSALIDADRLDTEKFYASTNSSLDIQSKSRHANRDHQAPTFEELRDRLGRYIDNLSAGASGAINDMRRRVRAVCREKGEDKDLRQGHFSLTVPTGGGKTLSAMEFALRHVIAHDLRRIIIVVPMTAIIEQTANEYRKAFSPIDGTATVVEHHGAVDLDNDLHKNEKNRNACENWDAPIVITTGVQFFESLLSNKPGKCRKLHNIANSVVIFDECQTFPIENLSTILNVLQQLVDCYGVTTVFSTATQPVLNGGPDGLTGGLQNVREVIPASDLQSNHALSKQRVRINWLNRGKATPYSDLAKEIVKHGDVLSITHLRDDAKSVVRELDALLGNETAYHLSAMMYPAHRRAVLNEIKTNRRNGVACRLVGTTVVSMGVDIDFPMLYTPLSELMLMIQCLGRCGRHDLNSGTAYIYEAPTSPPPTLVAGLSDTKALLRVYGNQFDPLDLSMFRKYSIQRYVGQSLDSRGIEALRREYRYQDVAKEFKIIDDKTFPVVIPATQDCKDILNRFRLGDANRYHLRKTQMYTVSVYKKAFDELKAKDLIEELPFSDSSEIYALREGCFQNHYDQRFGLVMTSKLSPDGAAGSES
jgi:CRISPR-associated endonuclease/helicase Cas3